MKRSKYSIVIEGKEFSIVNLRLVKAFPTIRHVAEFAARDMRKAAHIKNCWLNLIDCFI